MPYGVFVGVLFSMWSSSLDQTQTFFSFAPGNYVHDNGDAGMALLEAFNASVSDNTFENNKYGVRFSVGCGDNVFSNNIFKNSTK